MGRHETVEITTERALELARQDRLVEEAEDIADALEDLVNAMDDSYLWVPFHVRLVLERGREILRRVRP